MTPTLLGAAIALSACYTPAERSFTTADCAEPNACAPDASTDASDAAGEGPSDFALIRGGRFTMGSPTSELGRQADEKQHQVTLSHDFWMKRTEVTQGEWSVLMHTEPWASTGCGLTCPVETVSWWDAIAFANARSDVEGLARCYEPAGCSGTPGDRSYACESVAFSGIDCPGYRLPTEAEWEYAARAGTTGTNYTGNLTLDRQDCYSAVHLDNIAWYCANSGNVLHPVATTSIPANSLGLSDMYGNVVEWVHDWYGIYPDGPVDDPIGLDSGIRRTLRGGSGASVPIQLRAALRFSDPPDERGDALGFRLARTVR